MPERRQAPRRETDVEMKTIIERQVEAAPRMNKLINSLDHTWKIVGAIVALVTLMVSTGTAIGMNIRSPRQEMESRFSTVNLRMDSNAAHTNLLRRDVDSLMKVIVDQGKDIKTMKNLQCFSAITRNPEAATAMGCGEK
jgi:hypothetical protein